MTTSNLYLDGGGTRITIKDSGGTYVCTLSSLAAVSGRISDRVDLGAWPHAGWYRWGLETAWAANPVANETLDAYFSLWDNDAGPAAPWAGLGASDAALTATQRQNMKFLGSAVAETAGVGLCRGGGLAYLPARYVTFAFYNASAAKALAAVGTTPTIFSLTPIVSQQQ